MSHAEAANSLNLMDSKQRKKLCKHYLGSSTAEMSMQLSSTQHAPHNFADRDLYFNTMHYDDQATSAQIVDFPEQEPLVDDVPELQPQADNFESQ